MALFIKLFVVLIVFAFAQPAPSQVQKEGDTSFMGTILSISPNFESLIFFEKTVRLSASTIVLNEDGSQLTVQDLKPGRLVWVETTTGSKGLLAIKIILQKLRRV
jgi:hypothetical protein